jgi:hypothetical protein
MRVSRFLFALALLGLPGRACAGNVYGTLWAEGRPAGAGYTIAITCGKTIYKPVTQTDGSYRIFIHEKGACSAQITYGGQALTATIVSYDDPIKYDLEILKQNNTFILRKK